MRHRCSVCFAVLVGLLWPCQTGSAETILFPPEKLSRIQKGIRDIYNMEYNRATENFQGMIQEAPDDATGYAYLAMTYWIRELATKQELSIDRFAASDFFIEHPKYTPKVDPEVERRFRELSQQAIEKADQKLEGTPGDVTGRFIRGFAYQNLASFETSLKRKWLPAFKAGKRTFEDHKLLLRRDPTFHDARLAVGVYEYVLGSLPWYYKFIVFMLGHHGSKERGEQELLTAAQKATLVADDARIVLVLIYTRNHNYEKALEYLSELHQKYQQNYLVHLDMGAMELLMKKPDQAIATYEEVLRKHEAKERKYVELERASLHNRIGVAFREKGDLEASAKWFHKALQEDRLTDRSRTIAKLELGKTLDLMGRREEAIANYRAVVSAEDIAGSQEEAQKLLQSPFED